MAERKFTRGLNKPGSAAQVRETVREAVRESTVLSRPQLVEPIDYETFIQKNRTILQNDPQRELLLYPQDDVSQQRIPCKRRTEVSSVPPGIDLNKISSLFVRECMKSYTNDYNVINYKYNFYSGSFKQLPQLGKPTELQEQVFEIDVENDYKDQDKAVSIGSGSGIIKSGYLLRGPESGSDSFISLATKSFKRRYVSLRQEVDGAHVLEFHKDERMNDSKGTIFLDLCQEVGRASKRGKYGFVLHLNQGHVVKSCVLAAESERESEEWIETLSEIILTSGLKPDGHRRISLTNGDGIVDPITSAPYGYGTLKSLEHSMNPDLVKYSRETDFSIAQARRENRLKLFHVYSEIQSAALADVPEENIPNTEPFGEKFGSRFLVKCESIQFRLQLPIEAERGINNGQIEPYIATIALYDARRGVKISEDFSFELNSKHCRKMLSGFEEPVPRVKIESETSPRKRNESTSSNSSGKGIAPSVPHTNTSSLPPGLETIDLSWILNPNQAIFTVQHKDPDIYLVVRVEKCLQGGISQTVEPYIRHTTDSQKLAIKVYKVAKSCCSRLKGYKQPMAWSARPVFKPFSMELDTHSEFSHIYRQESSKLSDEDLLRTLADFKRPEKMSRFQIIPGKIKIEIKPLPNNLPNILSPSLLPVKPFKIPPVSSPVFEIAEFLSGSAKDAQPFSHYVNHLYVFPKSLKYESQKIFAKARNIACVLEFKDTDEESAKPLNCIYTKSGRQLFKTQARAAVIHHNTCPDFYEEVKILLPVHLHAKHHLLFTFYHISCETPKANNKDAPYESAIGYMWLPILLKGKLNVDNQALPVSTHLPSGYLNCQPLGLGKGFGGPEIRWVEGGKHVFKVNFNLVSTVNTKDQHLHNFFSHCQKLQEHKFLSGCDLETNLLAKDESKMAQNASGAELGREMSKYVKVQSSICKTIKALHAVDVTTLIQFLPTILNQLFKLLVKTGSEDVAVNAVRVLVHIIHELHYAGKEDVLRTYVKYAFMTDMADDSSPKKRASSTIHQELTKSLTTMLRPANTDFLVINKFLSHSWFFFQILIKSMAQHLLNTERIKMHRHERFPSDYQFRIQSLLQVLAPHILQKFREMPHETKKANESLAHFVKKCLTFMDRGFVFGLINFYMDKFNPGDPKILYEYKFNFLQVICSHEHFISLNLPVLRGTMTRGTSKNLKDFEQEFLLSEEFCKNHFLVGLLLQEFKAALNEVQDIRKIAINVLRDLLAKHSFDKRYQTRAQQARISSLYLPLFIIMLENLNRLKVPSKGTTDSDSAPTRRRTKKEAAPLSPVKSTNSTPSKRATINLDSRTLSQEPSPAKHVTIRDSSYLSIIAGASPANRNSLHGIQNGSCNGGSQESVASTSTLSEQTEFDSIKNGSVKEDDSDSMKTNSLTRKQQGHSRSASMPFAAQGHPKRYDKFDHAEVRDLLVCFLYITKNINEALLLGWFDQHSRTDVLEFFEVIQLCLHQFKYVGKKQLQNQHVSSSRCFNGIPKSMTLPARTAPPVIQNRCASTKSDYNSKNNASDADVMFSALMDANLTSEVGLIVLDILSLYMVNMKDILLQLEGENQLMEKIFSILLSFIQIGQSETLMKHVFAVTRAFINKFPVVLFKGNASYCGNLCFELLKCCNSRLLTVRHQACAILYLLMRGNYEFTKRRGVTRVHLQVIVSVSQLLGEITCLSNSRFQESLSIINNFANSDKAMQTSTFPSEVKDLTKRIRTVLMATVQMKEHESDPEMLTDLQHSLANSYASTPALRKTWLETMARNHVKNGDLSEAAFCYIHIAALQAQYLKQKGLYPHGCQAFAHISPNIERDETNLKEDSGMQDIQYTEESLLESLEVSCELLDRSERYELIGEVSKLITPLYEKKRNFPALVTCHKSLHAAYSKVVEVAKSGKRLLGTYFKVAFYGQPYFEEDASKEYIYKEPKITSLAEISERLYHQFCEKFGKEVVKMIMDSNQVDTNQLDSQYAYIQVTHVTPYFDELDLDTRPTEFEKNNNLKRFVFETPFTRGSNKAHGSIELQWKRRTILTTLYSFPYVKKRIAILATQTEELSPIEVAIDEMKTKVQELESVINVEPTDIKKLQLRLQGSVSVQVNAGPIAYASCFFTKDSIQKYTNAKVNELTDIFRHFMTACSEALELNARLVTTDQYEYHDSLCQNFNSLENMLSKILLDITDHADISNANRASSELFSFISGTPDSSTA